MTPEQFQRAVAKLKREKPSRWRNTVVLPRGTPAEVIREICVKCGEDTQVLIHPEDWPEVQRLEEKE